MQDNLEFLQWVRKYWNETYPGHNYDPVGRRKGQAADPPATIAPLGPSIRTHATSSGGGVSLNAAAGPVRGKTPVGGVGGKRTPLGGGKAAPGPSFAEFVAVQNQLNELTIHNEGLEKEKDFYFSKVWLLCRSNAVLSSHTYFQLRDIEILVGAQLEALELEGHPEDKTLKEIQTILYSTEVRRIGFPSGKHDLTAHR